MGAAAPLQILIPTKADKCVRDEEKSRSRSQSAAPEFSLILTELTEIYCGQMHDRIHSCTEFSTTGKSEKWWIALPIATRTIDQSPLGLCGQGAGTSPGAVHARAWAGVRGG